MIRIFFLLLLAGIPTSLIYGQKDACAGFRARNEALLREMEKLVEKIKDRDREIKNYQSGKVATAVSPSNSNAYTIPPCDCSKIQSKLERERQKSADYKAERDAANNQVKELARSKGDTTRAHQIAIAGKNSIIQSRTAQRDSALDAGRKLQEKLDKTKDTLTQRDNEIDKLAENYGLGLTRLFLEYEKPGFGKDVYYVPLGDERLNGSIGIGAGKEPDKAKIKPKNAKRLILLIEVFSTEPNDKLSVDVKIAPKSNRSATVFDDTAELEQDQNCKAGKYYYFSKTVSIDLEGQKKLLRSNNILKSNIPYVCNVSGGSISGFEILFTLE